MKKPSKSILDRAFVYVPSTATSVDQTWRRFGWRPLNEGVSHESRQASATASHSATAQQ